MAVRGVLPEESTRIGNPGLWESDCLLRRHKKLTGTMSLSDVFSLSALRTLALLKTRISNPGLSSGFYS